MTRSRWRGYFACSRALGLAERARLNAWRPRRRIRCGPAPFCFCRCRSLRDGGVTELGRSETALCVVCRLYKLRLLRSSRVQRGGGASPPPRLLALFPVRPSSAESIAPRSAVFGRKHCPPFGGTPPKALVLGGGGAVGAAVPAAGGTWPQSRGRTWRACWGVGVVRTLGQRATRRAGPRRAAHKQHKRGRPQTAGGARWTLLVIAGRRICGACVSPTVVLRWWSRCGDHRRETTRVGAKALFRGLRPRGPGCRYRCQGRAVFSRRRRRSRDGSRA